MSPFKKKKNCCLQSDFFHSSSSKVKDKTKKVTVYDNIKIPVKNEKETIHMVPLTGAEVAQMFTSRGGMGKWEQYFLKEVDGDSYRCAEINSSALFLCFAGTVLPSAAHS